VGKVEIRYYVTRCAWRNSRTWGYWVPSAKMRAAGFKIVKCGEDGPQAWAIAQQWNQQWDAVKTGAAATAPEARKLERVYPSGSLGEAFARFRSTNTWADKKPRTREDWERGWKRIEPIFGDVAPATVTLQDLDGWYSFQLERAGVREAHRAMKIWRALWRVVATMGYCSRDQDPSLAIRVKGPKARNAFWVEGEAVRLVKGAWRLGYHGLAAALAVAWDTSLSPIDVVSLTTAKLRYTKGLGDAKGALFETGRTKTGKSAIGTLSARTVRLLTAYMATLPKGYLPTAPIFRTRGGGRNQPVGYSRQFLGEDFRAVRATVLPGERRKIADFRRSGAVEATAGEVDPGALAGKMANSIDQSRDLQETYQPHTATLVRLADAARLKGRGRLRGEGGSK
jgi:hypothetical protein